MLLRSTIVVSLMALLGILLGFLGQLVVAYYFGATPARDAYFAAAVVPTYLTALFVGSMGSIFMSSYVRHQTRQSSVSLQLFVSRALNGFGLAGVVLAIVGSLFARTIVAIVAPGFGAEQSELTSSLLAVLFPSVTFTVLSALLTTLYQAEGRFFVPSMAPLLSIVVSIGVVLIWGDTVGIAALAWGTLLGSICGFLYLVPVVWHIGGYQFVIRPDEELHRLLWIAAPLLLTGIVTRSTGVFERMLASGLDPGSVSFLGYANQFVNSLSGIAVTGISTTVFPLMSRHWEQGDLASVRRYFSKGLGFILLLTFPIAASLLVMGNTVVRILLERGAFDAHATHAVSISLSMMMVAFVALSCGSLIARVFYITGKTGAFSVIVTTEVIVYLVSGTILIKYLSYLGLAAALSISSAFTVIVSLAVLERIVGGLEIRLLLRNVLRIGTAAAVMAAAMYGLHDWLSRYCSDLLLAILVGLVGVLLYAVFVIYVYPIQDAPAIRDRLKPWLQRGRVALSLKGSRGSHRVEDDTWR